MTTTMQRILDYTRGWDLQYKREGISQAKRENDRWLANYIHLYFKNKTLSDDEFERKHLLSDFHIKAI